MNPYDVQAATFLGKTGVSIQIDHLRYGYHFSDDCQKSEKRDIYEITLTKGNISHSFEFGQSIASTRKGEAPSSYDVLSVLQKYDVGPFDDFCEEFGYNELPLSDYPEVLKIYKACQKEYDTVVDFWNESEREELQGIS